MMEALLGAIFVDAGFAAAAATVERLWGERLGSHNPAPRPQTQLQEWAQARGLALPVYRQIGREGTGTTDVPGRGQRWCRSAGPGQGGPSATRKAMRRAC